MTKLRHFSLAIAILMSVYWFYVNVSMEFYRNSGFASNIALYIFPFSFYPSLAMTQTYQLLQIFGTVMMISWIAWAILRIAEVIKESDGHE